MKKDTINAIENWHNFRIRIVMESIIVGIFAGIICVSYRYLLQKAIEFAHFIYAFQLKNIWFIPIWAIILIVSAYMVGIIVHKNSMASGSGIPQVEGILIGRLSMNWWKVILGKFIGGVTAIGAGLSLGREGPSIQLGAAVGQGIGEIFRKDDSEKKILITSGASAGLAAAFNAPLAGCVFALEEIHKNFSPIILTSALAASITSDFITGEILGTTPVFNFKNIATMPLKNYFYIIILGIILAVFGWIFNCSLLKFQDIYNSQKWLNAKTKPIVAFLIAGVVGLILPQILGGGNDLVTSLTSSNFTVGMLIVLLLGKFLFTMTSYGSGTPGGIFLPLLVIGALIGDIYGQFIHAFLGLNYCYINNLMILGMAGYFSAVVKSPITGIILITEMTGSFSNLLSASVVSITSYVVSDILNSKPVYELLLGRILEKSKENKKESGKTIIQIPVCMGSSMEGKRIKEIKFPEKSLIVMLKRGEEEIIPKGNTVIYCGDYLIVLVDKVYENIVREEMIKLGESCPIK